MHLVVIPTALVCVLFDSAVPSLLVHAIFLYSCVHLSHMFLFLLLFFFFSSLPADPDGSGVVSHDSVHQLKSTKRDHCKVQNIHTTFASTLIQFTVS